MLTVGDAYFKALGKFAHNFARVETTLHFTLIMHSGIPQKLARLFTGPMRIGDLISTARQIAVIQKFPEAANSELCYLLDHINEISQLRDRLLHRGASEDGDKFITTNDATYKAIEDFERLPFSLKDLESASLDLRCIEIRLFRLFTSFQDVLPPEIWQSMEASIQNEVGELFGAWRYKPGRPETPNRPRRKKIQSHKPRRASSRK